MTEYAVGDRVVWHNWGASRKSSSIARSAKRESAVVFKVPKEKIGIELANGSRKFVARENLTKLAPTALKETT